MEKISLSLFIFLTIIFVIIKLYQYLTSLKLNSVESKQIEDTITTLKNLMPNRDNIITLMLENIKELKEYYIISKKQSQKSFQSALFICFIGVFIYFFGIASVLFFNTDITIISIVSGTIIEIISGLFFWLYTQSTKQLHIYHKRLGYTEKYLTVIQIIKELPEDNQYEEYRNLINYILNDNSKVLSKENTN